MLELGVGGVKIFTGEHTQDLITTLYLSDLILEGWVVVRGVRVPLLPLPDGSEGQLEGPIWFSHIRTFLSMLCHA